MEITTVTGFDYLLTSAGRPVFFEHTDLTAHKLLYGRDQFGWRDGGGEYNWQAIHGIVAAERCGGNKWKIVCSSAIKGLKPPIEGETPNMCHNCGTYNRPQYDSEDTGIAYKHKNRCCKSCGCSLTRAIV